MTKDQILKDIESLYQLALENGQWRIALRAKELQGKALGLFRPQRLPHIMRIADMTEEQLREFIARLEENDPELQQKGGTFPIGNISGSKAIL